MSAAGRALSKALDSPEDWFGDGQYTIKHMPSGQEFWVANGAGFFDLESPLIERHSIGWIERHWLFFKARKIIAKYASEYRARPAKSMIARFKAAQK